MTVVAFDFLLVFSSNSVVYLKQLSSYIQLNATRLEPGQQQEQEHFEIFILKTDFLRPSMKDIIN